jgi:hypothetical protein
LIPSTNWRISNDDQHIVEHLQLKNTSKGSIINEEQHEALLQDLVSEEKPKFSDHYLITLSGWRIFSTFRTMNGSLQWNLKNIDSSPKPFFKMKPNK